MSFSASCSAPEGDTGLDPCYPPSLLLNLAEKTPGLEEEQRRAGFTIEPEKESLKNGLIWSNRGDPLHAYSSNESYWSKQEAALLLIKLPKMARKFFSVLPLYGRCSALIGLRRPDPGFCARGLRSIFIICYNLAYMMCAHKGRISPYYAALNAARASGSRRVWEVMF